MLSHTTFVYYVAVKDIKIDLNVGEIPVRFVRVLHGDELFTGNVCVAWILWDQVGVLFIVDCLYFASRFDAGVFVACAGIRRLEFGTREGVRLFK